MKINHKRYDTNIKQNIVSKTETTFHKTQNEIVALEKDSQGWLHYSSSYLRTLFEKKQQLEIELSQRYKNREISWDEYLPQYQKLQNSSSYPTWQDIYDAERRETIAKYSYDISDETIQNYIASLGKDIQTGGANAKGVYIINGTNDKNLVAVVKSVGSYAFELPQRQLMKDIDNPRIPKVIDVFIYQNQTYKIMEQAVGKPLDALSPEERSAIPQTYYDLFVQTIVDAEKAGLVIDPSKPSNFFYDPHVGFQLIDLGYTQTLGNPTMFSHTANFNAHRILDEEKIKKALNIFLQKKNR